MNRIAIAILTLMTFASLGCFAMAGMILGGMW